MKKRKRAKKKQKRTRKGTPVVPVELRDQFDTSISVLHTVVAALSDDEPDVATTLLECVLLPLRRVGDRLEKAR